MSMPFQGAPSGSHLMDDEGENGENDDEGKDGLETVNEEEGDGQGQAGSGESDISVVEAVVERAVAENAAQQHKGHHGSSHGSHGHGYGAHKGHHHHHHHHQEKGPSQEEVLEEVLTAELAAAAQRVLKSRSVSNLGLNHNQEEGGGDDENGNVDEAEQGSSKSEKTGVKDLKALPNNERIDYFVSETMINSVVHQYLIGMKAHFSYWNNKDMMYYLVRCCRENKVVVVETPVTETAEEK
ncbi:hypothetical protein HDU76_002656 [Blyttiomyces sp. JEL0837]|nr:hypothetical protein HDU76_002656 [Blyttiomyces sp. JEL0837]